MKATIIFALFLFMSISCIAQTTLPETISLAIKYLRGQAGNYPNSLFVSGIIRDSDASTIWGIKPEALYEGCRGEVRVFSESSERKTVVLVREFATQEAADKEMAEVITAIRKNYPSLQTVEMATNTNPNLLEEKDFGDETNGTFASVLKVIKQPDAGADKLYRLNIFLER